MDGKKRHPVLKLYDDKNMGTDKDRKKPTVRAHFFSDVGAAFWDEMISLARINAGTNAADLEKEKILRTDVEHSD